MMAATYLAWQSLKPHKNRLSLTLHKFCQIARVNMSKPALKRIAEMKEMLCKLANQIPWLKKTVTPDNVLPQVEDILKYRFALLRRALRSHEEALLAECEERPPSHVEQVEEQSPSSLCSEQHELNTETGEDSVHADPAQNWGKRVLFAPPCVVHAKKRRAAQPASADVTGDEEISDSEISSYIRSPSEAREFALAQKNLSEDSRPL